MKEVPAGVPRRRAALIAPALVALATCAVFSGALRGGFLNWDDNFNFLTNPDYRGLGWANLRWMFTTLHQGPYQPLCWLTCAVDYLIWGMNPFGYHLTNVLFHAANAALFYEVALWFMSRSPAPSPAAGLSPRLAAAFAALLFAVHPLRVESVAWVTERKDVVSGFFCLWALLAYLRQHGGGSSSAKRWQAVCWSAFTLALLSRMLVVTLPAVFIILDVYPLRRLPGDVKRWFAAGYRRVWLEKLPFLVPLLPIALVGYVGQRQANTVFVESFAAHWAKALFRLGFFLWKTVWPVNLSPFVSPVPFDPFAWPYLASAAAVGLITSAVVLSYRRWPAGLAAWTCYVMTMAPILGIVSFGVQLVADRYSYLACLPWPLLAASGLSWAWQRARSRGRAMLGLAAAMTLAALVVLTWNQVKVWHDSETLWRHTLAVRPDSWVAHLNLGCSLDEQGKMEAAISHYREALRIRPDYAEAQYNWGFDLYRQGKTEDAIAHFREALRIKPDYAEAHNNWANALKRSGRAEEAAEHYRAAVRIRPDFPEARANLALVLAGQGRTEEGVAQYQEALRSNPGDARAQANLGAALAVQGKVEEAIVHDREALRLKPDYAEAHNNLGQALAVQGRLEEAAVHCREALRLKPDYAEAHFNLGNILAVESQPQEAAAQYREALRLKPAFVDAHNNLGIVLMKQGRLEEALRQWQETLRLDPRRESTRRNLETLRQNMGKP